MQLAEKAALAGWLAESLLSGQPAKEKYNSENGKIFEKTRKHENKYNERKLKCLALQCVSVSVRENHHERRRSMLKPAHAINRRG